MGLDFGSAPAVGGQIREKLGGSGSPEKEEAPPQHVTESAQHDPRGLGVGEADAAGEVTHAFARSRGSGDPKPQAIQKEVGAEPNERSPLHRKGGFGKQQKSHDTLQGSDQHEQFPILEDPKNWI